MVLTKLLYKLQIQTCILSWLPTTIAISFSFLACFRVSWLSINSCVFLLAWESELPLRNHSSNKIIQCDDAIFYFMLEQLPCPDTLGNAAFLFRTVENTLSTVRGFSIPGGWLRYDSCRGTKGFFLSLYPIRTQWWSLSKLNKVL